MAERLGAVSSKVFPDSRGRACGPPPESPLSPARRAAILDIGLWIANSRKPGASVFLPSASS